MAHPLQKPPLLSLFICTLLLLNSPAAFAQSPPPQPSPSLPSSQPPLQAPLLLRIATALDPNQTILAQTWNASSPCATWQGLTCANSGDVTGMNLTQFGLSGVLTPLLGGLPTLTSLVLRHNWLTGGIPPELANLTALTMLDIGWNLLSGPIPSELGNLRNLQHLDVSVNGRDTSNNNALLIGPVPDSFANLLSLQSIILDSNGLSATIPNIFSPLQALQSFSASSNLLTGGLPPSLCALPLLSSLDLSLNGLTGEINASLASSSALQILNLHGNQFNGSVPPGLGSQPSLVSLDLGANLLGGPLPNFTAQSLTYLDLSGNSLTGHLTIPFADPPLNLQTLLLARNSVQGSIPSSLSNLTQMQTLDLSSNSLTGVLPEGLSALTQLITLDLSSNFISGAIPPSWTDSLVVLQQLNLAYNSLNHDMSTLDFSPLQKCVKLALSNNEFSGSLPMALPPSLITLDLSSNGLGGDVNGSVFNLANLSSVVLNGNEFTGPIPLTLLSNPNLLLVNVDNNSLSALPPLPPPLANAISTFLTAAGNPLCQSPSASLSSSPTCASTPLASLKWFPSPLTRNYPTTCYAAGGNPCPGLEVPSIYLYNVSGGGGGSGSNSCVCAPPLVVTAVLATCPFLVLNENFDQLSQRLRTTFAHSLPKTLALDPLQIWVSAASQVNSKGAQSVVLQFFSKTADPLPLSTTSSILIALQNSSILGAKWGSLMVVSHVVTSLVPTSEYPPSTANGRFSLLGGWLIGVIVASGVLLLVLLVLTLFICCRKPKKAGVDLRSDFEREIESLFVRSVTLAEVEASTNGFDLDSVVGEGAFGVVYRGMSPEGEAWAVKRAKQAKVDSIEEFRNEVRAISCISHSNLVRLVGFCTEGREQILIYEFCANGTLTQHIRPKGVSSTVLSFEQRLTIAIGTSEGLRYMHTFANPAIIHRDIKSDNILLDKNMQAKVADFGLLKSVPSGEELADQGKGVAGTPGYIDPEYFMTLRVTDKSDVFSFGVVLLELITGKPPIFVNPNSEDNDVVALSRWASPHIKVAQLDMVVDPLLEGRYPPNSMRAMAKVAVECVERLSIDRPNMTEVANRLGALKTMQDQLARGLPNSVNEGSSVMSDHIPFLSEASGSSNIGMGGTSGADSRAGVFDSIQIGMGR